LVLNEDAAFTLLDAEAGFNIRASLEESRAYRAGAKDIPSPSQNAQ
jgi:hypothetical protein